MPRRRIRQDKTKPTIQQQQSASVENNFTGGLKTEFTGLNFPENSCTAVQNCVFTIIGDIARRGGINYEPNNTLNNINSANKAISTFRWLNAGGDGNSEILVTQTGATISFFRSSNATTASPLSAQILGQTLNLNTFLAAGNLTDPSLVECQYAMGNGYLFIFHPACDPIFCTFDPVGLVINTGAITLKIRDFTGFNPEPGNPPVTFRPSSLNSEHQYNLENQGWTSAPPWTATSTTGNLSTSGSQAGLTGTLGGSPPNPLPFNFTWTVPTGLPIIGGTPVSLAWTSKNSVYQATGDGSFSIKAQGSAAGIVTSYVGTSLTISVQSQVVDNLGSGGTWQFLGSTTWTISATNLINTISTWNTAVGGYPSNADIWWEFKDSTGAFNPGATIANVGLSTTQAPQGHYILQAFNQLRDTVSGIAGLTDTRTGQRPKTGAWFQGRVWYAGVDASQAVTGDAQYYTWTENIYFSQIIGDVGDFGSCYQANDPTNQDLFDLLPTDGGVIVIPGSGTIYKLHPVQNGLLVFADNGIWFITSSSGLGFTANDYSVNRISAIKSISGTSFIDVLGNPLFWNEEGIYAVEPSRDQIPYGHGGFTVNPLTVGTILGFYNSIPLDSKRFVKGAYNPVTYIVEWTYRSTQESGIANRYQYDSILNLNIHNKAFYPYAIGNNGHNFVAGINYMDYPSGTQTPQFKYLTTVNNTQLTFSEENDFTHWVDWFAFDSIGMDYSSSFTTGYKLHGQAIRRFQPLYVVVYTRNSSSPNGYNIFSTWDFATSKLSGKIGTQQVINNNTTFFSNIGSFGMIPRRHKLRGHGYAFQINVSSIKGMPFDIMGWAIEDTINVGV
jgi:hypothetical protein